MNLEYELAQEREQEEKEARNDLYAVFNELRRTFGMHNSQAAAHAVVAAAQQGRLTGSSYGYVDWEHGTVYGCVLGISQAVILGLGHLGGLPRPDFLERDPNHGGRHGHVIESYIGNVQKDMPDHPRSALLVDWLNYWLTREALG